MAEAESREQSVRIKRVSMATDPTILAVREMIGLVKQNIEFTLKKDGFLHCLKPKKPFGSHVKKSANSRTAVVR